jgi:hypothetical protein
VRAVAFAQGLDRVVQQLVHDAAGEFVELFALGGREVAELVRDALDLLAGKLMVALVEPIDHRAELTGAGPAHVALDLFVDDLAGVLDRFAAGRLRGRDDVLEVVEVVEVDVFELADRRLDVARERDVDEEDRAVAAGLAERLELFPGDDRVLRAGRGDDDVGGDEVVGEVLEGNGHAAEPLRKQIGFGGVAVADEQPAGLERVDRL